MLFPKWLCCQKRTFPLIFCGVLIAKITKSQVLGKGKNFIQAAPGVFENTEKYILPHFFYQIFCPKLRHLGKVRRGKTFSGNLNIWATVFFPSQIHLFTLRCWEPSSYGRAVSGGCTAASPTTHHMGDFSCAGGIPQAFGLLNLSLFSQHKVSPEGWVIAVAYVDRLCSIEYDKHSKCLLGATSWINKME